MASYFSSDWPSFSPSTSDNTTDADRTSNKSNKNIIPIASDSDGWPLDEIMNDIEQQMDQQTDAIAGMTKKLDEIEVSLSVARARRSKSRASSSICSSSITTTTTTSSPLGFLKNAAYIHLEEENENDATANHHRNNTP